MDKFRPERKEVEDDVLFRLFECFVRWVCDEPIEFRKVWGIHGANVGLPITVFYNPIFVHAHDAVVWDLTVRTLLFSLQANSYRVIREVRVGYTLSEIQIQPVFWRL